MKILFLIRSLARGGAERQLSLIASGLHKIGHDVVVVTYSSDGNFLANYNYKLLIDSGVRVQEVAKGWRYNVVGFFSRIISEIRTFSPEFIYSFLPLPNIVAAVYKLFNPNVFIIWAKRSSDMEFQKYSIAIRLEHSLERLLSKIPDLMICNSHTGMRYNQDIGYKTPMVVVPNGFDLPSLDFLNIEKQHYDIERVDPFVFLSVGRLDYAKDFDVLIDAFAVVVKKFDNVVLKIVGRINNIDYFNYLQTKIDLYQLRKKILFVPETNNVTIHYAQCNTFISSSYSEGFSNVICEAMLCGKPVIATNAGDSSFIVADCGIVVERRNPLALGDAMCEIMDYSNEELTLMGERGKNRIAINFSIEKLIANTEEAIMNLRTSVIDK